MPSRISKYWIFTMTGYTQVDLDRLSQPLDDVDYLMYGKDITGDGTPFVMGVVCFRTKKGLKYTIKTIGKAGFNITEHPKESVDYCKRCFEYTEIGDMNKILE